MPPPTSRCRWASSLPEDLVGLIASRVLAGDLLDYVRFRAVCAAWRSCTASPHGRGVVDPRYHPRRWMMLPEGGGLHPGHPKLHGYVRFFNLETGGLRPRPPAAVRGPLRLLVLQRDHDTAVRVLHPFTGDVIDLPPLSTLLPQLRPEKTKLAWLRAISTAATFADGAVTVMLAFKHLSRVAVAIPQDRQWTLATWFYGYGRPLLSSQGKIYVKHKKPFGDTLEFFQIDTPLPDEVLQPKKLIATCTEDKLLYTSVQFVECDSEILVIGSDTSMDPPKLLVYNLTDLRGFSVSAKALPGVTGDTITCFRHIEGKFQQYQYHLSSETWSPAIDQCSLNGIEPGPCSLILYIVTCCCRTYCD
ncbi:LOW QUALITY PROTEIN: hypothetical protein U9M48_010018 [Paspalum notatum var. saurae]|uniref:KIB1-4 beta-propeller domain-containing protein n=1 Tax=Paspalum notatum var. saurae TaxID=547442 RepID=A0AAQ3WFT7_PASNO